MEYSKYYDLENYLFGEISDNFKKRHYLTAEEFFCIIIWKANRAKSKIAKKFPNEIYLNEAVRRLTLSLFQADTNKEKLAILIEEYGFYLPMASAILSVLYQDEFSVYDIRVCKILDKNYNDIKFGNIKNWKFERLWNGYSTYLERVLEFSGKSNYRQADRFLWGMSFYEDLVFDIKRNFK